VIFRLIFLTSILTCFAHGEFLSIPPGSGNLIYQNDWIDFDKDGRKAPFEDPGAPLEHRVDDLLGRMTVDEKTCQLATLYGYRRVLADPLPTPEWKTRVWKDGIANIDEMHNGVGKSGAPDNPHIANPAATVTALNEIQRWFIEETRLGIPVEFTNEGIRGACYRKITNFPANLSLGATWNLDLIENIGTVVARESKALGYRNVYGTIMDLARDPRWGRVVECYGEDPFHVAEIGIRTSRAIAASGLISSAKHFAVYSEPKGGRDGNARTDPHVAPREMEVLHLWPWERLVKEGQLMGVMSSYNDYDGVPISGSREFLIDRLRNQWGFRGYVVSDSEAVEFLSTKHLVAKNPDGAAAMFIREGGNVRTHFTPPEDFILPLRREIAAGRLTMEIINARVRDVLRIKFLQGYFDRPFVDPEKAASQIRTEPAQALALTAARESLVLLKNENQILPLAKSLKRVLVCGPTAEMEETSHDRYGSNGGEIVNPLEGIRNFLTKLGVEVIHQKGCEVTDTRWPESELFPEPPAGGELEMIENAVAAAQSADVVIICLGDSNATIGESKSRTSLDPPGHQNALVRALLKTGKPVVAVLLIGKPMAFNYVQRHVSAVLHAGIPGEFGGTAIAEALFGDFNPGGKLPVTFPKTAGQIPLNFPYKPASHATQSKAPDPNGFGNSMAEGALYSFGFGLSYTSFSYRNCVISAPTIPADGELDISFTLTNSGKVAGDEVPQLYFQQETGSVTTYELNLAGFQRIHLKPGESREVTFKLPAKRLEIIDRSGRRCIEPGFFKLIIGSSSEDHRLQSRFEVKDAPKRN
jgi:beta-glucosidase